MLGYTFVGLGLMVDLGRYYNIWHPILPRMWQGNSVLFEVGMCVMCYLVVLYVEFLPAVCERFAADAHRPQLARSSRRALRILNRTMFLFILAGVVLSCLHQSSLGALMLIAPTKMHPLWYTPILPLLFLLSAIAVGFPMVIVESTISAWALRVPQESSVLCKLAGIIPVMLGLYLAAKIADLFIREAYGGVSEGSVQSLMFLIEVGVGVVLPLVMLCTARVRQSSGWRLTAALLVVLGVALNRVNVFLVAYQPPYAARPYLPSAGEVAVTIGLISLLILTYRVVVTYLPVLNVSREASVT